MARSRKMASRGVGGGGVTSSSGSRSPQPVIAAPQAKSLISLILCRAGGAVTRCGVHLGSTHKMLDPTFRLGALHLDIPRSFLAADAHLGAQALDRPMV